ncbi:MAG: hypothetical protein P4L40_03685 [Terracidiphilus sp.]|nr:hypothetical protein [Terracidiphilus sp.]
MENDVIGFAIAGTELVSGLIGTYVSLQNRALLAEIGKEMADLEDRLIFRINGTYIRRRECELREANVQQRIDSLTELVRNKDAASR